MARRPPIAGSVLPGFGLLLAGCALPGETPPALGATVCGAPRPEVCTMDYRPVCGWRKAGPSRTYSNACGACADLAVVAHTPGPCTE